MDNAPCESRLVMYTTSDHTRQQWWLAGGCAARGSSDALVSAPAVVSPMCTAHCMQLAVSVRTSYALDPLWVSISGAVVQGWVGECCGAWGSTPARQAGSSRGVLHGVRCQPHSRCLSGQAVWTTACSFGRASNTQTCMGLVCQLATGWPQLQTRKGSVAWSEVLCGAVTLAGLPCDWWWLSGQLAQQPGAALRGQAARSPCCAAWHPLDAGCGAC